MTTAVAPAEVAGADRSLAYVLGRIAVLEVAVRRAVGLRTSEDPTPGDPLRGVYLSDDYVAWLLDRPGATGPGATDPAATQLRAHLDRDADTAESHGVDVRLRRLSRDFGLTTLEEDLLVVALAPMLDRRFGQLFGYLNDDVTRRHATVDLAVGLVGGQPLGDPRGWLLVSAGCPLVAQELVQLTDADAPLPARCLRVVDRVAAFLLGDDTPDPALAQHLTAVDPLPVVDPALGVLRTPRTVLVRQHPGTDAAVEVATWITSVGTAPLVARLPGASGADLRDLLATLTRECLRARAPLVLGPVDRILQTGHGTAGVRDLVRRLPVVALWAEGDLQRTWATEAVARVDLVVPPAWHRARAWQVLCEDLAITEDEVRRTAARHRVAPRTPGERSSSRGPSPRPRGRPWTRPR